MSRGGGNVAIRTLLPVLTTTTRIGGSGYEYWVNNSNWMPSVTPDTVFSTPGKWRLEVIANQVTDTIVFLHTLKIGDSITPSAPGGTGQKNSYTIGVDWENILCFFSATGDTGTDYHLMTHVPGSRAVGLLAADLKPQQLFNILIDDVLVNTRMSDHTGILEYQTGVLPPGLHKVEIALKNDPSGSYTAGNLADCLITVFPNPANESIRLVSKQKSSTEISFTIFNSQGLKILSGKFTQSQNIDTKHFPGSAYWIVANDNINTQVVKVIIRR
jgi:predicted secreted protein